MHYYFEVLKKYAVFSGRARRKEYWMFYLVNSIIYFILMVIESIVGINVGSNESLLGSIYSLSILIPSYAVGVRRMHDVNKNGWYFLIPIYNLILTCTDGAKGDNKYGPDPKEVKTI